MFKAESFKLKAISKKIEEISFYNAPLGLIALGLQLFRHKDCAIVMTGITKWFIYHFKTILII